MAAVGFGLSLLCYNNSCHAVQRNCIGIRIDNMRKLKAFLLILSVTITSYAQSLPSDISTLFSGSGNCSMCHSAEGATFVSLSGEDISPVSTWRSTMMAHAAKDPLWQAKVTAEVAENPHLQPVIEDKCITCHAPMGRTESIYHGSDH